MIGSDTTHHHEDRPTASELDELLHGLHHKAVGHEAWGKPRYLATAPLLSSNVVLMVLQTAHLSEERIGSLEGD